MNAFSRFFMSKLAPANKIALVRESKHQASKRNAKHAHGAQIVHNKHVDLPNRERIAAYRMAKPALLARALASKHAVS